MIESSRYKKILRCRVCGHKGKTGAKNPEPDVVILPLKLLDPSKFSNKWCGRCLKKNKNLLENPEILYNEFQKYDKEFGTALQDLDSIQEKSQNDDKHVRKIRSDLPLSMKRAITRLRSSLKRVINLTNIHLLELVGYLDQLNSRVFDKLNRTEIIRNLVLCSDHFRTLQIQIQKLVFDLITIQVPHPEDNNKNSVHEKKFKHFLKKIIRKQVKIHDEDLRLVWNNEDAWKAAEYLGLYHATIIPLVGEDALEKLAIEVWKRVFNYMNTNSNFDLSKIDFRAAAREGQGSKSIFMTKGIEFQKRDGGTINSEDLLANPPIPESLLSRINYFKKNQDIYSNFEGHLITLEKNLFEVHVTATVINEMLEKNSASSMSMLVRSQPFVQIESPMYYSMAYDQLEEYATLRRAGTSIAQCTVAEYAKSRFFSKREFPYGIIIDLSKKNLQKINLRNADLRGSCFSGADMCHANLYGADLTGVSFQGAKMQHCVLTDAILKDTNFQNADLWGVSKGTSGSRNGEESTEESKIKKIGTFETCIESLVKFMNNEEITIGEKRFIFYHFATRKSVRLKRATLPHVSLLDTEHLENLVVMKDGLPFVTYDSKVIDDAWKCLLSLCTEVNKLSTLIVLHEQLLQTIDEVLGTRFTEDETTTRMHAKRKQYRNQLVARARELFLIRFTKAENKVNQNKCIRKYITRYGKIMEDWKDDLEEPNQKINLQDVNVTRLDFSGLDIRHVNISIDQLSRVTGLTTVIGLDTDTVTAIRQRKFEVATSMVVQADKEVEECRLIIEELPHIDTLACNGSAPNLDSLSDTALKIVAYLAFLSSPINFSPSNSPLHPLNIDYTLTEFMTKDGNQIKADLISVLQLRQFKLSREITSLVWCSKLSVLHNKVSDSVFLVVSDVMRIQPDLLPEEQDKIKSAVEDLKLKRDQILDKSASNCKQAEQHYIEMVLQNLDGDPDAIYEGTPTSRMKDALDVARDKTIIVDLRQVNLKSIKFEELSLTNVRVFLTLDQIKHVITPDQRKERELLFRKSIRDSNLLAVSDLITMGIDLEAHDEEGHTPLVQACLLGRRRIIRKLIKSNANISAKTKFGYKIVEHLSRFFDAMETQSQTQNRLKVIGILCFNGATMDLHSAAALGDLSTVRALSKDSSSLNSVHENEGRSPLHMAIEYGRRDVVIVLLGAGADRNVLSRMPVPLTPLQYACVHGNILIAQLLIQHDTQLDMLDRKERSLVTLAAENGHFELARLLLDFGAPVQIKSIILLEDLHRLKNFIQQVGGVNKSLRTWGLGHTMLHIAVQEEAVSVVTWLLTNGADPTSLDDFKKTPVLLACAKGNCTIMGLLIDELKKRSDGKAPSLKDYEIYLREAMVQGQAGIVKLLLESGADIHYRSNSSNTPHLHVAISKYPSARTDKQQSMSINTITPSYPMGLDILSWRDRISNNNKVAQLYSPRNKQDEPDIATSHHSYVEIVKLLLQYGADPTLLDDYLNTPLHMAAIKGSIPMMAAILSAHLTQIKNEDDHSVLDVWSHPPQELDVLLKPLLQVFSFFASGNSVFGYNMDLSKELLGKILSYVDRKTLHLVVPCVNHRWRMLYQDYVLEKKRKKYSS